MKKTTITVLFFFILKHFITGQIKVQGKVFENTNNVPVVGATVLINDIPRITDENGIFTVDVPKAGTYKFVVTSIGFKTMTQNIEITEGGKNAPEFYLDESNTLLQTTTVTAGKFEKPLSEVTVSMDVIKPNLVESVNARQIDAVLQKVPGVNIIDGQANIRGGSGWSYGAGSRVLLLVDDIPALQADAGFPNWKDIAVENLEQIEVVKGAASALYGSAAMNGIINVRTGFAKSKPETKFATQYTGFMSPKDKTQKWWTETPYEATATITHKQKFGNFDFAGSLFYFNQSSYREGWFDKFGRATFNTRYRITDRLSVGINANFNKGRSANYLYWKNNKAGILQNGSGPLSSSNKLRFNIDPYLNYFDKKGNRHKILGRYYNVDNEVTNDQSNHSQLFYGEYQFQRTFTEGVVLTAGIVSGGTRVSANLYGGNTLTSWNLAGYVQSDVKIGEKLNLSGGVRYEQNTINGPEQVTYFKNAVLTLRQDVPNKGKLKESKPVMRIGANYRLGESTYMRASWGQGYRFPTIAELYVNTTAGALLIVPNPLLTSETGWTGEVGVKQGFQFGGLQGFVDASVFQSEYKNMMEFLASPKLQKILQIGFESQNVGNTIIKGYELSLAGTGKLGEITPSFLIGYTYIDPKFKTFTEKDSLTSTAGYNVLKYRFKHNFKFDTEFSYKGFSVGAAILSNSHMENVDFILEAFIPGVKEFRRDNKSGFTTYDIRMSYKILEKLKLTAIGANLTNALYTYRPGLLEAPRNYSVRLDYTF